MKRANSHRIRNYQKHIHSYSAVAKKSLLSSYRTVNICIYLSYREVKSSEVSATGDVTGMGVTSAFVLSKINELINV